MTANNSAKISKLQKRIEKVDKNGDENHQTIKTWDAWFETDLKRSTIFDSSTAAKKHRPDLQIWENNEEKKASNLAPLWVEAKDYGQFKKLESLKKARSEFVKKVKSELRHKENSCPCIILSDLVIAELWSPEAIRPLLDDDRAASEPDYVIKLSNMSEKDEDIFINFINNALSNKAISSSQFDVDSLVKDFRLVTKICG